VSVEAGAQCWHAQAEFPQLPSTLLVATAAAMPPEFNDRVIAMAARSQKAMRRAELKARA
jgi:hypothetical protein